MEEEAERKLIDIIILNRAGKLLTVSDTPVPNSNLRTIEFTIEVPKERTKKQ